MRLKPLHTIWLTLISTLILLVSSVVYSAPLMSQKMMQSNSTLSAGSIADTNQHCGSHSVDMMISSITESAGSVTQCSDNSAMAHNCCPSACSFVFVSLPTPVNQPYPLAYRATINLETVEAVVQVTNNLYRPPIV